MAGIAGLYGNRYDSPVAFRLVGITINQEDDPWWVPAILGWLGIYKALMEAYGEVGKGYRQQAEDVLEHGAEHLEVSRKTGKTRAVYGANAIYAIYADYCDAMKRESEK